MGEETPSFQNQLEELEKDIRNVVLDVVFEDHKPSKAEIRDFQNQINEFLIDHKLPYYLLSDAEKIEDVYQRIDDIDALAYGFQFDPDAIREAEKQAIHREAKNEQHIQEYKNASRLKQFFMKKPDPATGDVANISPATAITTGVATAIGLGIAAHFLMDGDGTDEEPYAPPPGNQTADDPTFDNIPPTPVIDTDYPPYFANDPITLDSSESFDKDGHITKHVWIVDFLNGDLKIKDNRTAFNFTPEEPGKYRLTLAVGDNDGDAEFIQKIINVRPEEWDPEQRLDEEPLYDPADVEVNATLLTGTELQGQNITADPGDAPLARTHNKITPKADRAQLILKFTDADGNDLDTSMSLLYGNLYWNFNTRPHNVTGNHPDRLSMDNLTYNEDQHQWESEMFTVRCKEDVDHDRCYFRDIAFHLGVEFDGKLWGEGREWDDGREAWKYYDHETDTVFYDRGDYGILERYHELDPS